MKPVRLTMQAFGPYSECEIVDFRAAIEAGLFGIYGQTGSGKSTIFSAMTFALFGQAAKAEQDTQSLRSDGANPELATEVEFVFDIGDRRYVIRRRPEQRRPKQRGTGETRDVHEAWLFDATGMALEEITLEQSGKIIEEKKVGPVGRAVEGLLGYGAEQFRQIVLLPQGRFEAFLSADTKARLGILRDLFDVSLYRRLAIKMKIDAEAAERLYREDRAVLAGRLSAEGFETLDALKIGIDSENLVHKAIIEQEDAQRSQSKAAIAAVDSARVVDNLFKAVEITAKELGNLQAQACEFDALATRVRYAERARVLVSIEDQVIKAKQEFVIAEGVRDSKQARLVDSSNRAAEAFDIQQSLEVHAGQIDEMRREIETLKRHGQSLAKTDDVSDRVEKARLSVDIAQKTLQSSHQEFEKLTDKRRKQAEALKKARRVEAERQSIQEQLAKLTADTGLAEAAKKAEDDVTLSIDDIERLSADHRRAVDAASVAKSAHDVAENELSEAQALHLASKLQLGEACPVCGALDHPAPAAGNVEHAGLDNAFRQAKENRERLQAVERDIHTKLASARSVYKERSLRLETLSQPGHSLAELREACVAARTALGGLGEPTNIYAAESSLEILDQKLLELETAREKCRVAHQTAELELAEARTQLEAMLFDIPADLRDANLMISAIEGKREAVQKHDLARRAASEAVTKTREEEIVARKEWEAAQDILEDRQKRLKNLRMDFASQLTAAGLDEEAYKSLKAAIENIEQDRETVEDYRRRLHSAEQMARKAIEAISGLGRPDLAPLLEAVEQAELTLQAVQSHRAEAKARLDHLNKLLRELSATIDKLEHAENETGPLRELAALFDSKNPLNLDLETFAIGAMFDQVLIAANQRLGPMTGQRYSLERASEGGGRGRRGLGIHVHDIYTGKPRPTSTLSGGESFIAALSLALGLADVVESSSGKVRLDTIFIDEGFGSLDTENGTGTLDQVLQALGSLVSQNRAVGIISHVPLVQEAIPNGFYVRKNLTGSRVEHRDLI